MLGSELKVLKVKVAALFVVVVIESNTHTNTRLRHHTDVASTTKGGVVTWDVSDATPVLAHEFTRQTY